MSEILMTGEALETALQICWGSRVAVVDENGGIWHDDGIVTCIWEGSAVEVVDSSGDVDSSGVFPCRWVTLKGSTDGSGR